MQIEFSSGSFYGENNFFLCDHKKPTSAVTKIAKMMLIVTLHRTMDYENRTIIIETIAIAKYDYLSFIEFPSGSRL